MSRVAPLLIGTSLLIACGGKSVEPHPVAGAAGAEPTIEPRLVPWQLEADGTLPYVVGIYDTEQRTACRYVLDEDGQLRCLPPAMTWNRRFADPECQVPVYRTRSGLAPVSIVPSPSVCGPRHEVWTVRALPSNAQVFSTGVAGDCVAAPPFDQQGADVTLAERVPAADYVAGSEVDGPLWNGRVRIRRVRGEDGSRFDHATLDTRWQKPCVLAPLELRRYGRRSAATTLQPARSSLRRAVLGRPGR